VSNNGIRDIVRRKASIAALMIVQRLYHVAGDAMSKRMVEETVAREADVTVDQVDDWITGQCSIPEPRALKIIAALGSEAERVRFCPEPESKEMECAPKNGNRGEFTRGIWNAVARLESVVDRIERSVSAYDVLKDQIANDAGSPALK